MENNRRPQVLKRRQEFLDIKNNGRSFRINPWLLVSFKKNSLNDYRCGWTISKKVGSAVVRNRLKRWCREFFRVQVSENPSIDFNIILIGKDKEFYKSLSHDIFDRELSRSWQKVVRHATARA